MLLRLDVCNPFEFIGSAKCQYGTDALLIFEKKNENLSGKY